MIQTDRKRLVVGLGATGRSTMRFLQRSGMSFVAIDTRADFPGRDELQSEFPGVEFHFGVMPSQVCSHADDIYLSPGLAPDAADVAGLLDAGGRLSGDLDLFMSAVDAPVIGITGSNAKSTVTTMVGDICAAAGVPVAVGGNLGTPMLDLLEQQAKLYVLELSSFQLERAEAARFEVACLLNVSADHMDRHKTLVRYHQVKQSVFAAARVAIFNREDALTEPMQRQGLIKRSFGWKPAGLHDFCVVQNDGREQVCKGVTPLFYADELALPGRHNLLNAMAALAIAEAAGVSLPAATATVLAFKGLEHRCELVAALDGVRFINDSKATNVGACVAALQGFASDAGKIVLIAGGQTKGADFSALAQTVGKLRCALVLLGEGAAQIAQACSGREPGIDIRFANNMHEAVRVAQGLAKEGDIVLLSPACASFDMYQGFAQRGNAFRDAVQSLDKGVKR